MQQTLQMAGQKPILARPSPQQWQIKAPMEMQLKRDLAPAARNNASSRDARILKNSFRDIYMLRQQQDSRGVGSLAFQSLQISNQKRKETGMVAGNSDLEQILDAKKKASDKKKFKR